MCHFVNLTHVFKSTASNECSSKQNTEKKSERIYSNSYSNLYADLNDIVKEFER